MKFKEKLLKAFLAIVITLLAGMLSLFIVKENPF
jgi:hypothetical protein